MRHLGILVKTASRARWACNLAEAASDRGKNVWIHFAEHGVCGLCGKDLEILSRFGKVSICETSTERYGQNPQLSRQCGPYLAPPSTVAELVSGCDRLVVL